MFKKTLIASSLLVLFSQAALAADTVRWLNDWLLCCCSVPFGL